MISAPRVGRADSSVLRLMSVLCAFTVAAALVPLGAAPIPVRFAEGVTHGFLVLRDVGGAVLADGDLLQVPRNGEIDKRMKFRFKDGSVLDERVTFTQRDVYTLKTYDLSEHGPAFPADIEVSMTIGSGACRVKSKDRRSGVEKNFEGHIDLPADVYNGLVLTVVKNLPKGAGELVHYVAFTPQPRLIELELKPAGEDTIEVGELTKTAVHYVMKPHLGAWLRMFATIVGRAPEDSDVWVFTDDVPAFVEFQGSLTTPGPVWRIELVNPRRPG